MANIYKEEAMAKQSQDRTSHISDWAREKVERYKIERERINDEREANEFHDGVRIASRLLFDNLLEECQKRQCPNVPYDLFYLHCLSDISLAGYILETAYDYWEKREGIDDRARYLDATERIRKVLNCTLPPRIDVSLLLEDSRQILVGTRWGCKYEGARKRKAYWAYLDGKSRRTKSLHLQDHGEADRFIRKLHEISLKPETVVSEFDVDIVRQLLNDSFHIANALDLYRLCAIRKKLT